MVPEEKASYRDSVVKFSVKEVKVSWISPGKFFFILWKIL